LPIPKRSVGAARRWSWTASNSAVQQSLPRRSEPYAAAFAIEEPDSEPALGFMELMACTRLGKTECARSKTQLAVAADGDQKLIVPSVQVGHMRNPNA